MSFGEHTPLMCCQVVLIRLREGGEVQTGWLVDAPRGGFSVDGSITCQSVAVVVSGK